jgi:hypothetical protein
LFGWFGHGGILRQAAIQGNDVLQRQVFLVQRIHLPPRGFEVVVI